MKYNLHTHSFYCRHGEGTIPQYTEEAQRLGLDMLGFSEHVCFPDRTYESNKSRMFYIMKPYYERDVRKAATTSKIPVFLGYECDIVPGKDEYLKSLVTTTDYLISSVHFFTGKDGSTISVFNERINEKGNLGIYTDLYIHGLEMGIFLFGAHPDVFMNSCQQWNSETKAVSKAIISAAKDLHIPLELNVNGIRKATAKSLPEYGYPNRNFWQMASELGISCCKNSDAHSIKDMSYCEDKMDDFIKEMNLKMVDSKIKEGKPVFFTEDTV